ncbi:Putative methyl-CpG binding protein MeCP2/MBD4 [Septoria linicola]|uniref:Methyl-CpG binding protein MeCP2/MBD4 n=1 Tax=Septoria linicola TaxID=215465 RepID=A0A9Q9B5D4_9PEZI|nr:Putative methyl-CpG binding protein MeCP2/MBD4 [Septoria linicola]
MEPSKSLKRSFSASASATATDDTAVAVKNKKKKQSKKPSDQIEISLTAEPAAKSSKRKRRREKGKLQDGNAHVLSTTPATSGGTDQRSLEEPQLSFTQDRDKPVKEKALASQKTSSINHKPSKTKAETSGSNQHNAGKATDTQTKKALKKAEKARKARQAREAAALGGSDPKTAKLAKSHIGHDPMPTKIKQKPSSTIAHEASIAIADEEMDVENDDVRELETHPGQMLKPFEIDWDVIELKAAEKAAVDDVAWSRLTADQRSKLVEHYIGRHTAINTMQSGDNSPKHDEGATHGDSGSSDSSSSVESESLENNARPPTTEKSSTIATTHHPAQIASPPRSVIPVSQAHRTFAPRIGQNSPFKPLGDRRLSAVPTRLGTGATLADTRAKFQRLSQALNERRGGGSSDDSDTGSSSEGQSEDDVAASKPAVRGSVSETFAEQMKTTSLDVAGTDSEVSHRSDANDQAVLNGSNLSDAVDEAEDDEDEQEVSVDRATTPGDDAASPGSKLALDDTETKQSIVELESGAEERDADPRASPSRPGMHASFPSHRSIGEQELMVELMPLDEHDSSAESGDEPLITPAAARHDNAEGDSTETSGTDSSEDEDSSPNKISGRVSGSPNSEEVVPPASPEQLEQNEQGRQDQESDISGSGSVHDDAEQDIVLNNDGELVMGSRTATIEPSARDGIDAKTADSIAGQEAVDLDEDMHGAGDLEQDASAELEEEISDAENHSVASPSRAHDEQLESTDDAESSELAEEEDRARTTTHAREHAFDPWTIFSQKHAAGIGSATPNPSSPANVSLKITSSSQESRGGAPSGLSHEPQASDDAAAGKTFQDFAMTTPVIEASDLEEKAGISGILQSVFADTRPLPEGEDPDTVSTSQAGSEHELIKDNDSISQDSIELRAASADAGDQNKVSVAAPPHHVEQVPPPELNLSDSDTDTDSSEEETEATGAVANVEEQAALEPFCANVTPDSKKLHDAFSSANGNEDQRYNNLPPEVQAAIATATGTPQTSSVKKRKMTGNTSTHFATPSKLRSSKKQLPQEQDRSQDQNGPVVTPSIEVNSSRADVQSSVDLEHPTPSDPAARKKRSPSKRTGTISEHFIEDRVDLYNTTAGKRRKVPAGQSANPFPAIDTPDFGIIQERTWHEPFWLIIATVFLNKTTGRQAAPIFWKIRKRWPSPADLADADYDELFEMIKHLGLQHQRTKRLKGLAAAWHAHPPQASKRHRTLHYPSKGDGKEIKKDAIVDEDADDCAGALEIAHIPGCGAYAYDSWRIFCRDVLRGVATDYQGANAKGDDFEPEWKRVLPGDKELRACLRWMWLKEGIIWEPLTGDKRNATEEEMEKAKRGELELEDEAEAKFAAQAAGVDASSPKGAARGDDALEESPQKRGSLKTEPSTASAIDAGADWALQNSQQQANEAAGLAVETAKPQPKKRASRAAKSKSKPVDDEETGAVPAKCRGRPMKLVVESGLKKEADAQPEVEPATVTRSTRAKRRRSPSVEVDETRSSPVAKKRKTATKKEVVKEEGPRRQSARLLESDGLV